MLRIISGIYRSRKIMEPDLKITRPTTDKVREAIFSSLQFKINDKSCLDLFSGSGAMSIESISRGAKISYAIEKNRNIYHTLVSNITSLNIKEKILTFNTDALLFLENNQKQFDFIFLDAPFNEYDLVNNTLLKIYNKQTLNQDGEIILETNNVSKIIIPYGLKIYKQKRYGKIDILYICYE
ncbi:16S rRNA (guanine(966)-N(2))-methyltransferase RsmD [Mycoplasmopsis felis]|uniref:16S rRNA (guanine(966)-N(2))-methyltransferase RsmD n=1 Tax=Mycoplasmopsis felis TaxID=33923 RepID=UPI002AF6B802|nr:16S rRNA (guanine(966)-N(2))-methyltransferase RsmD [Mycoplasmopsis felis]WQQ01958.1 16S rRNA (guanine(966)-N(2))-methyltransferase RsmD [Mycoplasmopsis felis]WQQ08095.1 16S rRNA (guanine(966)-N(2))-methyltransferase RsmD [Mycoplasmopsis felis]